ncbi:MAG TPA: hypothetical protein VFN31_00820, partial [Candidatus Saccharimonadales bacterium]|nr:hypothetical protein [Candidatus Saccharimonadales bacterium]
MRILPKFSQLTSPTTTDDLIRAEAEMGGKLFGDVPKNHARQFFCLDQHTWVWHESWHDQDGNHSVTTRYEVRPNGIFKVQNGGSYQSLSESETRNFIRAASLYADKVISKYDAQLQTA